ncbi:hypothetical protein DPMN_059202 [Dreissena polymorpha]|uniref:Uncharacterized protein n=1 Tax=Dreissena polymorpha TaxID=45954 RepID=A0A9D4HGC8_DREPO|nr:hypothetical protein DPMN_059202 [Dreissena polymorpha]
MAALATPKNPDAYVLLPSDAPAKKAPANKMAASATAKIPDVYVLLPFAAPAKKAQAN